MKWRKGFTLIEVLVAVLLLTVLLGSIYGAFFAIEDAVRLSRGSVVKLQEARTTLDIIRREIEAALPQNDRRSVSLMDRDVYGAKASVLTFETALSPLPGGAVVRYSVREEDGGEKLYLVKTVSRLGDDLDRTPDSIEVDAVEDLVSFDVEVLNRGQWVGTWRQDPYPKDFKVTLTIKLHEAEVPLSIRAKPYVGGTM